MVAGTDSTKRQRFIDGIRNALGDSGSPTGARANLNRGKQSNFLLAIMLNSFARHSEGKELKDLEKRFVDGFRKIGYSDADFATIGRIYTTEASSQAKSNIFSGKFASLGTNDGYGIAELRADMPQLAKEALESKNLWVVDASRVHLPHATLNHSGELEAPLKPQEPSSSFIEATRSTGWGVVCYGLPVNHPASAIPSPQSIGRCMVWAYSLHCINESSGEVGKDEPQFGIAVSDGKAGGSYTSEEFSMSTGDTKYFKPNLIWDNELRGGGLVITLDAWEQDNGGGFENEVRLLDEVLNYLLDELLIENWAEMNQTIIGEITGAGVPPWLIAISIGIIALIRGILNNPDDYIGSYHSIIPMNVLSSWATSSGSNLTTIPIWTANDGDWEVNLRVMAAPPKGSASIPPKFRIVSKRDGKAVTIEDASTSNEARLIQYEVNKGQNQVWEAIHLGGGEYRIVSALSNKAITVKDLSLDNETDIVQYQVNNGSNQSWFLIQKGQDTYIISKHSKAALTVEGSGYRVVQFVLNTESNQVWRLESA